MAHLAQHKVAEATLKFKEALRLDPQIAEGSMRWPGCTRWGDDLRRRQPPDNDVERLSRDYRVAVQDSDTILSVFTRNFGRSFHGFLTGCRRRHRLASAWPVSANS